MPKVNIGDKVLDMDMNMYMYIYMYKPFSYVMIL